jgi:hypothetical protein
MLFAELFIPQSSPFFFVQYIYIDCSAVGRIRCMDSGQGIWSYISCQSVSPNEHIYVDENKSPDTHPTIPMTNNVFIKKVKTIIRGQSFNLCQRIQT